MRISVVTHIYYSSPQSSFTWSEGLRYFSTDFSRQCVLAEKPNEISTDNYLIIAEYIKEAEKGNKDEVDSEFNPKFCERFIYERELTIELTKRLGDWAQPSESISGLKEVKRNINSIKKL